MVLKKNKCLPIKNYFRVGCFSLHNFRLFSTDSNGVFENKTIVKNVFNLRSKRNTEFRVKSTHVYCRKFHVGQFTF